MPSIANSDPPVKRVVHDHITVNGHLGTDDSRASVTLTVMPTIYMPPLAQEPRERQHDEMCFLSSTIHFSASQAVELGEALVAVGRALGGVTAEEPSDG